VPERAQPVVPPVSGTLEVDGLSAPVRVIRDTWGIPHIQAASQADLFFAQGFVQAQDRLFQMDLWRRSAQGRLAEVLGANFIGRDAMTRRIQYRGRLDEEWASYGPDTRAIASAFVRGINAWVAIARERPPASFVLAGWGPEYWRPEDLLNRTDAFLASGDAQAEVFRARLIASVGVARAEAWLGSDAPSAVPPGFDPATIGFQLGDVLRQIGTRPFFTTVQAQAAGSNAWAISGPRSATGAPVLATDPHRLLANPSLRYLVHLTAPGWNVIGATAPWMPGVAVGHNDRVAWGMTALDADTADLYVERLNPENRHQIEAGGRWQNTTVVRESMLVKGRAKPLAFEREYTPHGVVIGVDRERHLAFTLRWSGMAPGAAGELAALGLDRAESGAAIRAALARWKMPAVEVLYAERSGGAIGLQAAALLPVRRGWDGRLPAAGWTGRSEWDGWRAVDELPRAVDPPAGYLASANRSRARTERLRAVFTSAAPGRPFSVEDSARLQHDVLAWNAGRLVPLLARLRPARADVEDVRRRLLTWDRRVTADSMDATVYVTWERLARRMLVESRVPGELVDELVIRSNEMLVPALTGPSRIWFDGDVVRARDQLMLRALTAAVDELAAAGEATGRRLWGQMHGIVFAHPLGITEATRRLNVGPFERAGYAETVMSASGRVPDSGVGASFRAIFDAADWDRSIATNAPGQSESPDSAHFSDLARLWAAGEYFPLAFTEAAVSASAKSTLTLVPTRR
jgi:penicillin amidase